MSANHWDQYTFRILCAMVALLAAPVLWSWFGPPDAQVTVAAIGQKAVRGVASIASAESKPPEGKLSRPVTLKWDLSEKEFSKEIDGTHLRLKGFVKGLKASSITNESNGFTASVFLTGAEFTTDFIELKEGPNQIQVRLIDEKGRASTKKIEVTRHLAATAVQNE